MASRGVCCCNELILFVRTGVDGVHRQEPIDSEDAVAGLRDTHGVCGILREADVAPTHPSIFLVSYRPLAKKAAPMCNSEIAAKTQ